MVDWSEETKVVRYITTVDGLTIEVTDREEGDLWDFTISDKDGTRLARSRYFGLPERAKEAALQWVAEYKGR